MVSNAELDGCLLVDVTSPSLLNEIPNLLNRATLTAKVNYCVAVRAHRPQIADRIHDVLLLNVRKRNNMVHENEAFRYGAVD